MSGWLARRQELAQQRREATARDKASQRERRSEEAEEDKVVGQLVQHGFLTKMPYYSDGSVMKSFAGSYHWLTIPFQLNGFNVHADSVDTNWATKQPCISFAFFEDGAGRAIQNGPGFEQHVITIQASRLGDWRSAIQEQLKELEKRETERFMETAQRRERLYEALELKKE